MNHMLFGDNIINHSSCLVLMDFSKSSLAWNV